MVMIGTDTIPDFPQQAAAFKKKIQICEGESAALQYLEPISRSRSIVWII